MAIEDPQRSQATMWVEVQSLCQKSSTPQTPQGGQPPQGETERSNLIPPPIPERRAPQQPNEPQASPYLTRA